MRLFSSWFLVFMLLFSWSDGWSIHHLLLITRSTHSRIFLKLFAKVQSFSNVQIFYIAANFLNNFILFVWQAYWARLESPSTVARALHKQSDSQTDAMNTKKLSKTPKQLDCLWYTELRSLTLCVSSYKKEIFNF